MKRNKQTCLRRHIRMHRTLARPTLHYNPTKRPKTLFDLYEKRTHLPCSTCCTPLLNPRLGEACSCSVWKISFQLQALAQCFNVFVARFLCLAVCQLFAPSRHSGLTSPKLACCSIPYSGRFGYRVKLEDLIWFCYSVRRRIPALVSLCKAKTWNCMCHLQAKIRWNYLKPNWCYTYRIGIFDWNFAY